MATFKVLLDKRRQLQNGTYPLLLRIYNDDKHRDIGLKVHLKEHQFDSSTQKVKRNHPNEKIINMRIRQAILKVQETSLKLEMNEEVITAHKIKSTIVKPRPQWNFIQFGDKLIQDMRNVGRQGNANAYRDAIAALKTYSGRTDLQFKEVDYRLLCHIENKMLAEGLKRNTIAAYNRALRAIYNRAIKEDLVEIKFYPYRHFKIKVEPTSKRNIGKTEVLAIANFQLQANTPAWHSRNFFMLSFNLRGMNFTDMALIQKTDIRDGRLLYKRRKTHKVYNVKLTKLAEELLQHYIKEGGKFILPILPDNVPENSELEKKTIQQELKTCNKYLKRIGEELELPQALTTYVSRHSWATIAKKAGYSKDLISEALGHSFGNRITEIYLDSFDQEVIDDMNEQVCKF